ncbi:MAG: hypothetical protein JWM33_3638, partial [Caulobacteraceae bacterium]|nr:hypothetical protein [Caulobacteraceae bacterium]
AVMTNCVFGFSTPALSKWAAEMIDKVPKGFNVTTASYAEGFPPATRPPSSSTPD